MKIISKISDKTKKHSKSSPAKIIGNIYFIILVLVFNTSVCFAGDSSDKILYFMIGLMIISAIGIVGFILFEMKNKEKSGK
ncbi:MAG: hypothetical protein RR048_00830 [Oscillospiraceae bacterium]